MTVVSPKKHGDAERVADISRRLVENPETAEGVTARPFLTGILSCAFLAHVAVSIPAETDRFRNTGGRRDSGESRRPRQANVLLLRLS